MKILTYLILLAAIARVVTAYLLPNVVHPDETFQYLEQAFRLVTGKGLIPWEYVVGARSWILPGMIAFVLKAALYISSAPAFYLGCVTAAMILLAVTGVVAAFHLGLRTGGIAHATFAGLLTAIWTELVYLSPHVLADTVSAMTLIGALATSYKIDHPNYRSMLAAGLLFGLTFVLRLQLAPAIAVAMLCLCGTQLRSRYLPMAMGFLAPVIVMGITDWIALGVPFQSAVVYLLVNSGGVADAFGTLPSYVYVVNEFYIWGLMTPVVLITAYLGAKRLPLLAVVAAVILLTFTLVGHKEYRFIYPALPLIFALCGVGTVDLVIDVQLWRKIRSAIPLLNAAAVVWLVAAVVTGLRPPIRERWVRDAPILLDIAQINADPSACGVGIEPTSSWYLVGRVQMRGDVPLYQTEPSRTTGAAYNYIISFKAEDGETDPVTPSRTYDTAGYTQIGCASGSHPVCLSKRNGACNATAGVALKADPDDDVRSVLLKLGFNIR